MKKCPKCGAEAFEVTAHVTQSWRVDGNANFLECIENCEEVTHAPDDEDIWVCANCGYDAAGREFNVPESECRKKSLKLLDSRLLTEKEYTEKKDLIPSCHIPWWLNGEDKTKYSVVDASGNLTSCNNGSHYNCLRPVLECENLKELGVKPADRIKIGKKDYFIVLTDGLIIAEKISDVTPFDFGCQHAGYEKSYIKEKVHNWFDRFLLVNEVEGGSKAVLCEI